MATWYIKSEKLLLEPVFYGECIKAEKKNAVGPVFYGECIKAEKKCCWTRVL